MSKPATQGILYRTANGVFFLTGLFAVIVVLNAWLGAVDVDSIDPVVTGSIEQIIDNSD
ncbi:MAG: hypothetical protein AAF468_18155 [Pseudomonadota bacterium]